MGKECNRRLCNIGLFSRIVDVLHSIFAEFFHKNQTNINFNFNLREEQFPQKELFFGI